MASKFRDEALGALLSTYGTSARCALRNSSKKKVRCGLVARCITTTTTTATSASWAQLLHVKGAAKRRQGQILRSRTFVLSSSSNDSNSKRYFSSPTATTTTTTTSNADPEAPTEVPRDVAVLGGGLTGLATAFYLWRWLPSGSRVTVYEGSGRTGGWIDTERVRVPLPDGGEKTVRFERGARVVQAQNSRASWDDLVFYELVHYLGLTPELRHTSADERIRRFVYYPDHLVDVTGPDINPQDPFGTAGSLLAHAVDLVREPLFRGLVPSMWGMASHLWNNRGPKLPLPTSPGAVAGAGAEDDVSVGDWFAARFGRRDLVDNMLSALVHGVYGGDVWKLSMASSIFARLALRERLGSPGSGRVWCRPEDISLLYHVTHDAPAVAELARAGQHRGYLAFRDGFSTLTEGLDTFLRAQPNVTIKLGQKVNKLRYKEGGSVEVTTEKGTRARHDKVVSTLFARDLASLTEDQLPTLAESKAVTIQLVNLWYPKADLKRPEHQGFGYLVPSTVKSDKNPDGVLGVLFDSDRDAVLRGENADSADVSTNSSDDTNPGGTSLTVMMGGHYWDGLPSSWHHDAATAELVAKRAVESHLGIPATEPAVSGTKLCRDCIPQHVVGHPGRMATAHAELLRAFHGRLAVAGGSYQAPGVLGGLRAARDVAAEVSAPGGRGYVGGVGATGLARFLSGEAGGGSGPAFYPMERRLMPFRFGNGEVRITLAEGKHLTFEEV